MDSLEKALRNALSKGDADDPSFRLKVYSAAERALQKTIDAGLDAASAAERKRHLASVVSAIERAFAAPNAPGPDVRATKADDHPIPGVAPEPQARHEAAGAAPPVDIPARAARPGPAEAPPIEPTVRPASQPHPTRATPADARVEPTATLEPSLVARPSHKPQTALPEAPARARQVPGSRRRRRPYAIAFAVLVLVAAAGMTAWWLVDTGALLTAEQRDTSVPNPPAQLEEEGFSPNEPEEPIAGRLLPSEPLDEGMPVLTPSDPTNVAMFGGATADLRSDGGDRFLLVAPGGASSGLAVEIGQGILRRISAAGGTVLLVGRSAGEAVSEISVTCAFEGGGDCGRQRFTVAPSMGDYLFALDPAEVGSSPAGGRLVFTFGAGAAPVEIRSVSIIPGD